MVGLLSACAGNTTAVIDSLRYAVQRDSTIEKTLLNPELRYLRATIRGRTALLVLGYVENHPQGPIQVWYSAEREVLRLQNGRLVGAVGLIVEWRNVTVSPLPAWASLAVTGQAEHLVRARDVMPGYRYGVKDILSLKRSAPPSGSALQVLDPHSLAWFEESMEFEPGQAALASEIGLPTARYAVAFGGDAEEVVYGEQCLSREFCFAWQRWPAAPLSRTETR